ncbi:hypothetical protein OHA77_30955 [Streptosporangium sp. NBC_01639]|uniref:hypothetical protein n=1 Tax=Streptosporangium sp. NBC_01639 TaxID=2975948 RepID=UPI0038649BD5|nr:hypothetical protein OHA77_30955 [Streptosporangium sp. NBC_01639]
MVDAEHSSQQGIQMSRTPKTCFEAAPANRTAWEVLESLPIPFPVAFSDRDFGGGGSPDSLRNRVAGAAGQAHTTIENPGHFVQEDKGPEPAAIIHSTR